MSTPAVSDRLDRFAELVVRVGVNVQPGQTVVLRADIAQAPVARAVVDQAWAAGARDVEVIWADGPVRRSAVVHAGLDVLTASSDWMLQRIAGWERDGVAYVRLTGNPHPHLMDGLDPAKVAAVPVAQSSAIRQALFSGHGLTWTIVAAPDAGWAEQVYGEPDVERLWADVGVAMRLDEPDPVAAWRARDAELTARASALDALALTEVHYVGPGTDLVVGLLPQTRWTGGGMVTPTGVGFMPNVPTEEVFTSPDRRRADGRIALSRPLATQGGGLVEGLELEFAAGRIVTVKADRGAEEVTAQLETDDGARSLGEVSLVDRDSRIARTGVVFHETLFDENAGCHVAWGQSFPFAVAGGPAMSADERFALGLNSSAVHTDVVIGGTGMTVTGTGPGGEVTIVRDDEWVLPV